MWVGEGWKKTQKNPSRDIQLLNTTELVLPDPGLLNLGMMQRSLSIVDRNGIEINMTRYDLEKMYPMHCAEYSEYLMKNVTDECVICNGDTLIAAMENGILYEEFIDSLCNT